MECEVDGGEGGLERRELGAGKGAVGDDAVDEGLVDGGAKEGTIAVSGSSVLVAKTCLGEGERRGGPDDVVGGGAGED